MTARRKVVRNIPTTSLNIDTNRLTASERDALNKDKHLLEAALATDRVIVTRDITLTHILAKTRKGARLLEEVCWINPTEGKTPCLLVSRQGSE